MDDKVIQERAEDAAAALSGRKELIEALFSYLMGVAVSNLLTTEPHETEKREAFYHKCTAISELKASLESMAGESRRRKAGRT